MTVTEPASCGAAYCTADAEIGPHRHGGGVITRLPLSPAEALAGLSRWVDGSYLPDLDPEAADWRRLTKVCEEAGEAISAYAGSIGENPRKGVTHTSQDVLSETLDAAVAALAAVEHFTGNEGNALTLLHEHILAVATRAGVTFKDPR